MKVFISALVLVAVMMVLGCKKYSNLKDTNTLGNKPQQLFGRLFLLDSFTQRALNVPLAGKKLTLVYKDAADTLNYIYSTTTDSEGYYQFQNLRSDRQYKILYKEVVDGKLYEGQAVSAVPNDTCAVIARLSTDGQTGVLFNVTDPNGHSLSGADICVFSSPIPYNANSCDGSNFTVKSDQYGKNAKFNLKPGTYYVLSKMTINNILYVNKQSFTIEKKIEFINIKLDATSTAPNGLSVLVLDVEGNPVNNAAVCLFTSRILYGRDTCDGSNYSTFSNAVGKAVITNVQSGTYYVLANLSLTNMKMFGRDTVLIDDRLQETVIRIQE